MNQRRFPVDIHVTCAEDIAMTHGYDQVVILARLPSQPGCPDGAEWVTTWGRSPQDKQAAAVIGKAIREGVADPLERLRGLLREARVYIAQRTTPTTAEAAVGSLVHRIDAELAPVVLELPGSPAYGDSFHPDRAP